MSGVEKEDRESASPSADSHDVGSGNGFTAQSSSAESIASVYTATEEPFRLEDLTLEKATDLGYPTEQTFEQSFRSSSSSEDLEKGIIAPVLVQQQLGAHDYEKSDASPGIRKDLDTAASYKISHPPDRLPTLPHKRSRRILRGLRYNLLAVYQRLFSVVFIGNMTAFIIGVVYHRHSYPFGPPLGNLATAVAANVMGAILIRQEYVINSLYNIFCWTPLWMPLRFRRVVSKLYHFGGVHSGCAVSATAWFVLYSALVTKRYADGDFDEPAVIAITYSLLALLLALCVFAIPKLRIASHNTFEAVHRFGGWAAVALFWVDILLVLHAESTKAGTASFGALVVQAPAFWFLLVVTFFIVLPWIRLRKVEAFPEVLSKHAVRIHFQHSYKNIGNVIGLRITHNPMKEWHAFATIPDADGSSFSLIVSDNGDWTKKQIMEPAHSYWIRGIPVTGVLRMATVFRRILLVTTGSGIGPCLSFLTSHPMPCRLLWSTPNPVQTYGEDVMRAVAKADPNAMIINTRATGRPDVVALAYHLYLETKAESVFVISNPYLTSKLVYGLESRGIPAYGPIWDS
ncbi:hypothetical protein IMSHALPRED_009478 [Imshaugia aleurites]|uniref:Nonribosomal peptide synthetase 12 n=1 Tax=Imshaugia aleurites TaxID=172621 RepID=A0A8H3G6A2_9LECA|nr:hypothetical protein IMSHALPRED_009478 [Imshaugia aleurites]